MTNTCDFAGKNGLLEAEAATFGLLGRLLAAQPDPAWLAQLVEVGVFAEMPLGAGLPEVEDGLGVLRAWADAARGGAAGVVGACCEASSAYFGLFEGAGSPPAPIWESVYFNDKRMVFGDQTLDVRRRYAVWGLFVERKNAVPDDNLGLELLFAAHLSQLASDALAVGEEARAADVLSARNDFLEEHTLSWAFDWAELVAVASRTHARTSDLAFWHGIALLTRGLLEAVSCAWGLAPRNQTLLVRGC